MSFGSPKTAHSVLTCYFSRIVFQSADRVEQAYPERKFQYSTGSLSVTLTHCGGNRVEKTVDVKINSRQVVRQTVNRFVYVMALQLRTAPLLLLLLTRGVSAEAKPLLLLLQGSFNHF